MNQEELQQKIAEYYSKLPKNAQEVFSSMKWLEILRSISDRHSLNEEQVQTLGTETTLILLGIIHRDEYEKLVTEELKLPKEKIESILEEINTLILNPIISDLLETFVKNNTPEETKENSKIEQSGPINQNTNTQFAKLSPEIQNIINQSDYQTKIYSVGQKNNLTIAQISELEKIVTDTILGQIPGDKFEESVKISLGLETEKVTLITQELNEKVLREIRNNVLGLDNKIENEGNEKLPPTLPEVSTRKEQPVSTQNTPITTTQKSEDKENIDSILSKKLAGAFKMGGATTEYSLNNISKQNDSTAVNSTKENNAKSVDPYRMPIE